MDSFNITKRTAIIALLLLFFAAPLCGYFISQLSSNSNNISKPSDQPKRSQEQIQSILRKKLSETDPSLKHLSVTSVKRYDYWWYVVQVKIYGTHTKVLLGDFHPSLNDINIIYGPDQASNQISEVGVPYSIVDMFSRPGDSNG